MFRLHPSHGQAVGPSLLRAEGGHATRLALINSAVEEFAQIKKGQPIGLSFKYIRPCKGYFAKLTDLVSLITVIFT